jgi:hypothetical protein
VSLAPQIQKFSTEIEIEVEKFRGGVYATESANHSPIFGPIEDGGKDAANHSAQNVSYTRNSRVAVYAARMNHVSASSIMMQGTNAPTIAERRRQSFASPAARVYAAYKTKAQKILPVNEDDPTGDAPGGVNDWEERAIRREQELGIEDPGKWDKWLNPKRSAILRGTRLTSERVNALCIGTTLSTQEHELLMAMLSNREAALSWEFSEIGSCHPDVAPPQVIRTVPHTPYVAKNFAIPKALEPIAIEMLLERLDNGLLEYGQGPYRNPWFLVKKGDKPDLDPKAYRLINAATEMNKVSLKDGCLPPNVEEFVEHFTGMPVASVLDMFSGYDQIALDHRSRNLTGFQTPLGLLRATTLPQGATNSVAQFVRIITKVLRDLLAHVARPFVDDIAVGTRRNIDMKEEAMPGVRRFILEHIQNLDKTLLKLERAGFTVSGKKMQLCMDSIELVGYVCDSNGRHPKQTSVSKIASWGPCKSKTEVRAFLGVVGYFRVWIENHASRASALYMLIRKDIEFFWHEAQQAAMDDLKQALINAAALASISYALNPNTGVIDEIIVLCDASGIGWGGALCQTQQGKRRPIRYESGLWKGTQLQYDAGKLECLALLLMLRKTRLWLYGVAFTVETDAAILIAQLNNHVTDIPNAMTTRWIAYIKLFDFTLRHVPGKVHEAADGLSRRGYQEQDDELDITGNIEAILSAELHHVTVAIGGLAPSRIGPKALIVRCYPASPPTERNNDQRHSRILDPHYGEESEEIASYLQTLQRPEYMSRDKFRRFRLHAVKFLVKDDILYKRSAKQTPLRRVIDNVEQQDAIINTAHEEALTHRGIEATYQFLSIRYYWFGMYEDTKRYIQQCKECQFRESRRYREEMHPTFVSHGFEAVSIDVVHMEPSHGKHYGVFARCQFYGWLEGRGLRDATATAIANFIWEDIICRHGCPRRIIMDGGPENKNAIVDELLKRYNIKKIEISAYHPQANGLIEVGHKPIKNCLAKLKHAGKGTWMNNLSAVIWADRVTIRGPTGMSPFEMLTGNIPLLPIDLEFPTWIVHDWSSIRSTEDLLAYRAIQLSRREEDLEEAAARLRRMRLQGKELFDDSHALRRNPLKKDDMVLLFNSKDIMDRSTRTRALPKWTGPFRIQEVNIDKGYYFLAEMDGSLNTKPVTGDRIKRFYVKDSINPIASTITTPEPHEIPAPLQTDIAQSGPLMPIEDMNKAISHPYVLIPTTNISQHYNLAEDNDSPWEVQEIVGHRKNRQGGTPRSAFQYHVKWIGYLLEDTDEDWMTSDQLAGSQELLKEYQKRVGLPLTRPTRINQME